MSDRRVRLTREAAEKLTCCASRFMSVRCVRAHRLTDDIAWSATEDRSKLQALSGDWVLTDADDAWAGFWTVEQNVFSATYQEVRPGIFRKTAVVRAAQLKEDALVETIEGDVSAVAGDWLVTNPTGDSWPVKNAEFVLRYKEIPLGEEPGAGSPLCG